MDVFCLHAQKFETVEKTFHSGAKHLEKYYEQYLEKHVDVSRYIFIIIAVLL